LKEELTVNKKRSGLGIVLVALGLMLALVNFGVFGGNMFLPLVSLALLSMYVAFGGRRNDGNLGFLIPGCIVGAIGLYANLDEAGVFGRDSGGIFLMMLGIAFLIIMVVHTMRSDDKDWGARYWPVFPAAGLIGTGVVAQANLNLPFNIWNMIGPVVLIGIGLNIWIKSRRENNEEGSDS
jgi:hypothetical protein